ncbi:MULTISPECIES: hypothetical protein [Halorussus]|uniref:hypothetical protein n=1 Tax=Halorussus TaxID=1070314 RepID=UPI000E20F524|nr:MULTISPECIES: hypothetical protein [Halorussus]NHN58762.1 hypothetical protein [Halorussus sp. JP-T4]
MLLERMLALSTALVLAGTFPVAVIASRGFRGAPFGRVLRPIPVVVLAFAALNAPEALGVEISAGLYLVLSTAAVAGTLVAAAHALVLLTERRKL